jgi:hypothetical protein
MVHTALSFYPSSFSYRRFIGSLRAGHGSRFVLADTEELHTRIAQMSQRIRQLEDALAVAHSNGDPKNRHPLLRDELLALKFGSDFHQLKEESEEDIPLSFGTLAITDSGGSKYFGVSAGALVCRFFPGIIHVMLIDDTIGRPSC